MVTVSGTLVHRVPFWQFLCPFGALHDIFRHLGPRVRHRGAAGINTDVE